MNSKAGYGLSWTDKEKSVLDAEARTKPFELCLSSAVFSVLGHLFDLCEGSTKMIGKGAANLWGLFDGHAFEAAFSVLGVIPEPSDQLFATSWNSFGGSLRLFPWCARLIVMSCVPFLVCLVILSMRELVGLSDQFRYGGLIKRLYRWPAAERLFDGVLLLRSCCICFGFLLECAEPDPEYEVSLGGVHILLWIFRGCLGSYISLEFCRFMRWREELNPKFPKKCSIVAGRRTAHRQWQPVSPHKRILATMMLLNLLGAEGISVTVGITQLLHEYDLLFGQELRNGQSFNSSKDSPATGVYDSALEDLQESPNFDPFLVRESEMTFLPFSVSEVQNRGSCWSSCARPGYHTRPRAVHGFCPHFEADNVTNTSRPDSGATPSSRNALRSQWHSFVQLSMRVQMKSCDACAWSLQPPTRCSNVQVWFAEKMSCLRQPRHLSFDRNELVDLQAMFTELWRDKCGSTLCDYTIVRPQPTNFDFDIDQMHFLVYRHLESWEIPSLVVKQNSISIDEVLITYHSCVLSKLGLRRSLLMTDTLRHGEELVSIQNDASNRMTGGLLLIHVRPGSEHGREYINEEVSSLMQKSTMLGDHAHDGDYDAPSDLSDELCLMQSSTRREDGLLEYVRQVVPDPIRVVVWLHTADEIGNTCRKYDMIALRFFEPVDQQIRQVWSHVYGRRTCYIFPVRPAPMTAIGRQPNFIVTTVRGEGLFPVLFQYVADVDRYRGTFILRTRRFLTVAELFQLIIPQNVCLWQNICTVIVPVDTGEVTYSFFQVVPIYEGIFLILSELGPETDSSSGSSTCDSLGDAEAFDSSATNFSADETGEDEEEQVLMQTDLESPEALRDLTEYVRVYGSSDGVVASDSYYGVLRLSDRISRTTDVARKYISDRLPIATETVSTVYVWIVTGACSHFARTAILQPNFPFSQSLVRTISDVVGTDEFGVSMIFPLLMPLTLRVMPLDLVVLTAQQGARNQRVFIVDTVFARSFPVRNAVLCNQGMIGEEVADLLGASRDCLRSKNKCEFHMISELNTLVWSLDQVLDAPHASSLQLIIEPIREENATSHPCQLLQREDSLVQSENVGQGDNTATPSTMGQEHRPEDEDVVEFMQQSSQMFRSALHQYFRQFASGTVSGIFWIHSEPADLAQQHPSPCAVDLQREALWQCKALWEHVDADSRQIVVVDPPPVFLMLPRPHVIVHAASPEYYVPILCHVSVDGRYNTVSVLLSVRYPPTSVAAVFELAEPQHNCEVNAECYLYYFDRKYAYRHDIQVEKGAFLRLYEWSQNDDSSSTTCDFGPSIATSPTEGTYDEFPEIQPTEEINFFSNENEDEEHALFQLDMMVLGQEEESLLVEDLAVTEMRRETQWRLRANMIYRKTHLHNWSLLMTELAMASTVGRVRRYLPIRFFSADFATKTDLFHFDHRLELDELNLVYHIRLFLQDTYRLFEDVKLSVVKPIPTPFQQGGLDAICVVMELWMDDASRLGMVAATGIREDIEPVLKGYRFPRWLLTAEVFERIGLADFCTSPRFRCHLSYDFSELPNLLPWRVLEGMRLDLQVVEDTCGFDSLRSFQFPSLLMHILDGDPGEGRAHDPAREPDSLSLMQRIGGNTATPHGTGRNIAPEDGTNPLTRSHFQRACWLRTFWLPPLILTHQLVIAAWNWHAKDVVKEHFASQGYRRVRMQLTGWMFYSNEQEIGHSFCWGLGMSNPWSFQLDHLLRGTGMQESAIFTVLPQTSEEPHDPDQSGVQVVILPGHYPHSPALVLVVTLSFDRAAGAQAVRCGIPCTPLTLFHQTGQMAFCGLWTLCQVHFRHGDCQRTFTDTEAILLPIASKVELDFKRSQVKINHCQSVQSEAHYAKNLADNLIRQVRPYNPYVHRQDSRSRGSNDVSSKEQESVFLSDGNSFMQRPLRPRSLYTDYRQIRQDVEEIRTRTWQRRSDCSQYGVTFHFVYETDQGARHWTETCPAVDHQSPHAFFEWVTEQLPDSVQGVWSNRVRVILASRRIIPNVWTLIFPLAPMVRPVPILVRLLHAGEYHETLHVLAVDSLESIHNIHHMVTGRDRMSLASQIHDIPVRPEHYTNISPGLVIDIQEIASPARRSTSSQTGTAGEGSESVRDDDTSEETLFMQVSMEQKNEEETAHPSQPVTLSTLSMQASTLSSGPPPLHQADAHYISHEDAVGRTRDALLGYWQGQPWFSTNDGLYVHCVSFRRGETVSFAVLCPASILEDLRALDHFSDFCDRLCRPVEYSHSRVFPAQVEIYQNVPSIVLVDECRGVDAPTIVLIARHDEPEEPRILVFVATQTIPVSFLLTWIETHVDLVHDFVLEHNGNAVQATQMITFAPGDVFIVRTVPANRIPDTSTSQGNHPASSSDSHDSWEGQTLPMEHLSLLQFSYTLKAIRMIGESDKSMTQNNVSSESSTGLRQPLWFLSPCEGLRPPGNPTFWGGRDMHEMDTYYRHRDWFMVVDASACRQPWPKTSPESHGVCNGNVISIADAIPDLASHAERVSLPLFDLLGGRRPVPTPCRAPVNPPQLLKSMHLPMPDFQPFWDLIFQNRMLPQMDWQLLLDILPEKVHDQFKAVVLEWPPVLGEIWIYTDGSNTEDDTLKPAWSFVAFTFLGDEAFLLGLDYGLVYTEPMEEGWIGAEGSAAKEAEATAIVRALEWALGTGLEKPHHFEYDADAVGGAVAGRYSVQENDKIIRVARAMAKTLEAFLMCQPISWQHVKGHSGVLGNEIADALAKWAYRNQYECGHRRPDYIPLVCGPAMAIEHAWIFFQSQGDDPSLPSWDNQVMHLPPIQQEQGIEGRVPLAFQRHEKEQYVLKPLPLSALTFNVNTLLPKAGNVMVGFLREQLSAHGFYITFLQETRARTSNVVRSATHARIVSAAVSGAWWCRNLAFA